MTLKDPSKWTVIGKDTRRLDTPEKVTGKAVFGLDVKLPDLATAVVARPPVFGGTLKGFDDCKAKAVPGVRAVFAVPSGVAVVADDFWSAKKGRDALTVDWEKGPNAALESAKLLEEYLALSKTPGLTAKSEGDVAAALSRAAKKVTATYTVPYLAHAPMEPLNCTVKKTAGGCEIWTGTQFQTNDQGIAAKILGVEPKNVLIHTTFLGGGFGRRANPTSDFVAEAVHVAKGFDRPVKVVWTRDDDIRGGYYRPMAVHRIEGALDANGKPAAWRHRIVSSSILEGTPFAAMMVKNGIDETSVEGASDSPYVLAIPSHLVELHTAKKSVPVLWWRSVGHSHTAFAVESFLDEMAHAAGKDPLAFRLALLAKAPRLHAALKLAAEKAGWGKPLPKGHGLGLAVHESFESIVAQVAEVTVEKGRIRVPRVVCAVDCGTAVNPLAVRAQMESAIAFGLGAALKSRLTLERGTRRREQLPRLRGPEDVGDAARRGAHPEQPREDGGRRRARHASDRARRRERAFRGDGEEAARPAAEARMRAAPRVLAPRLCALVGRARRRAPSVRRARARRRKGRARARRGARRVRHGRESAPAPALPELSHPGRRAASVRRRPPARAERRTRTGGIWSAGTPVRDVSRRGEPARELRAAHAARARRAGSFRRRASRWCSSGCRTGSSAGA